MIRGTTPTHSFIIPFEIANISIVSVAYSQNGNVVVEKVISDCEITVEAGKTTISTKLTEEETLDLTAGNVEIQIRLGDSTGDRYASDIIKTTVKRLLKDGVLNG